MILYFSATGNTRFIAEILGERLKDEVLDMTERIKKKDYSPIYSKKPFIICSPVYVSVIPEFFHEHLKYQVLSGNRKLYFVFTAAGHIGISGMLGASIARKKKMRYMGSASVAMPNNYVASNLFAAMVRTDIADCIRDAKKEASRISREIREGKKLQSRRVSFFEWIFTLALVPLWFRFMQPSRPFHANDACIGCGKCTRVCPLNNIRMRHKKPVWKGGPCSHCMACIGNCPVEAIEYGKKTQHKEKYHIKKHIRSLD